MKVCSFFPAATQMIYAMGLQEHLYGVTFECASDKPQVVRSYLEGAHRSSSEIDKVVAEFKRDGKSLYYVEEALLESIGPDLIFAQEVCEVCQIDVAFARQAMQKLGRQPKIIPLLPHTLKDVFENAVVIAAAMGQEASAHFHLAMLQNRLDKITSALSESKAPIREVMVLEWVDPIYNSGHWIPDQVAAAGAVDLLSHPGGYSSAISFEKVLAYNPEVLVVAPCGFNVQRALQEMMALTSRTGWSGLRAVKNNEVYLVDGAFFTQPGTSLVDGIELLAALFHPELFQVPAHMLSHVLSLDETILEQEKIQ